jgi:hypothetical protein
MARSGGGRPTAESCLTLDICWLMRRGACAPRKLGAGTLTFSQAGYRTGSIGYEIAMADDRGFMQLRYTSTVWDGEKRKHDYRIDLTATPQPFGGRRWWFICPKRGDLVRKLYLPPGAFTFPSREAYRIGYRSQRESPHDRDINRAFKLRRRLGSEDGLDAPIEKPKGLHWKTYGRQMRKVKAAEAATLPRTLALLERLQAGRSR